MKRLLHLSFAFFLMGLVGCGGESNPEASSDATAEKNNGLIDTSTIKEEVGEEMYDRARNMFYSMPSPLELQSLLIQSGGSYQDDILHNPQSNTQYQTTEELAFALGVYGTDMCYSTVFDQQQDALLYMAAAQKVAKKIGITDPFNGALIARADANMDNRDSMLLIVSEIYWEMNSQLQEENRNQLGLIILAAGWVEGIYLGTELVDASDTESELVHTLMDQRFIAVQMDNMFRDYTDDPIISSAEPVFRALIDKYISLQMDESPTTVTQEDGKTVIGGAKKINYTSDDITEIQRLTAEARAKIIKA